MHSLRNNASLLYLVQERYLHLREIYAKQLVGLRDSMALNIEKNGI